MKTIRTEIIIDARKEDVWKILTDFPSHPNWNPFIKKIQGELVPGGQIDVTLEIEGTKPTRFKPLLLTVIPEEKFCWRGKLFIKGIFDGTHYFILEEMDDSTTKFIQGENFQGLLAGPILKKIKKATQTGFEKMNQALKEKTEKAVSQI